MTVSRRNPIVTFAVAYHSYHDAIQAGRDYTVWQDMLVEVADDLGVQDPEMEGLADARAEVRRRRDDAVAFYPLTGDQ